MADSKLTALTAETAPVGADLIYLVDDVAGTPTSKKATLTDLAASVPFAGLLIGLKNHDPSTALSVTTTSGTFADVDATNLAVTFTAPASGNVLVRLTAGISLAAGTEMGWGLRESTTDLNDGIVGYAGASTLEMQQTIAFYISGLTPGASKTYKWSHARVFGTGNCITRCGGGSGAMGPAIMEVWSAP